MFNSVILQLLPENHQRKVSLIIIETLLTRKAKLLDQLEQTSNEILETNIEHGTISSIFKKSELLVAINHQSCLIANILSRSKMPENLDSLNTEDLVSFANTILLSLNDALSFETNLLSLNAEQKGKHLAIISLVNDLNLEIERNMINYSYDLRILE